jgi:hypothetical protein
MAGSRISGPLGGNGGVAIGFGPRDSTYATAGGIGDEPLSQEESEVLWDVAQLLAFVIGAAEPSPGVDTGTSLMCLVRGGWLGSSMSIVGVAPRIADLARVGMLAQSAVKARGAIEQAKSNQRLGQRLRPLLGKLHLLLDRLPPGRLPQPTQITIDGLKRDLEGYLRTGLSGASPRAVMRGAKLPPGTIVPPSQRPRAYKTQYTHAEVRHDYTGNVEFDKKSKFDSVSDIDDVIARSGHYDAIVGHNGNLIITFDTHVISGWDAARARQTTTATVIMKPTGEVVTVHPGRPTKIPVPSAGKKL